MYNEFINVVKIFFFWIVSRWECVWLVLLYSMWMFCKIKEIKSEDCIINSEVMIKED